MPLNSKKEFHLNPQVGRARESFQDAEPGETENSTTISDNGDGSYITERGGERTEHPSLGHALSHVANTHDPEGRHVITSRGQDGITSHDSDGLEHDHANLEELKRALDQFFTEEGEESAPTEDTGKESKFNLGGY